jgi:ABC-type multidrug transport system fused ATPase/permease subunit
MIDFQVSLDRLWKFLQQEELATDAVERVPRVGSGSPTADLAITIRAGNFNWNPDAIPHTLTNVNLQVKAGSRVAVCGMVGSGKTSLISCILGEIPVVSGAVRILKLALPYVKFSFMSFALAVSRLGHIFE